MVDFLDKLKKIGFDYATTSGISISPFELGEVVNKENHLARMNPNEFFISVYGAIKGMIDVALKTASAGDLARRLAEASQSIIITAEDCQTRNSILCQENDPALLAEKIYGRCLAQDLTTEQNGVILARNTFLFKKQIQIIQTKQITAVEVRSPLGCELELGICQACYGSDLSRPGEAIALHTAVGIIAAQSLSEPGTQLTMRTFHTGGIAAEEDDIIQGLDKVKQIFDNVKIKELEKAILARNTGEI
ncbi:15144_t:CDS:2, partial [Racocetra persica]